MEINSQMFNQKNSQKINEFWTMINEVKQNDDKSQKITDSEKLLVYKSLLKLSQDEDILGGMAVMYYKSQTCRMFLKSAFKEYQDLQNKL